MGEPKSDRCGSLTSAGWKRQHGGKDMPSNIVDFRLSIRRLYQSLSPPLAEATSGRCNAALFRTRKPLTMAASPIGMAPGGFIAVGRRTCFEVTSQRHNSGQRP